MTQHRPLQLLQLTDIHLCEPSGDLKNSGVNTDLSLQRVLTHHAAAGPPPDLILATGDLAQDPCPEVYQRLQHIFRRFFQPPILCIPGNHDDPALMLAHLVTANIMMPIHWIIGHWQLIFLDTSVAGKTSGALVSSDYHTLRQCLGQHPEHHALICLHHHPRPTGSPSMDRYMLAEPDRLFAEIARYPQVRGLLWGHIHRAFHEKHGELHCIGSPSTCIQFAEHDGELIIADLPPAYRRLRLSADGTIETEVVYVTPE